jgi:hypothetical protein
MNRLNCPVIWVRRFIRSPGIALKEVAQLHHTADVAIFPCHLLTILEFLLAVDR